MGSSLKICPALFLSQYLAFNKNSTLLSAYESQHNKLQSVLKNYELSHMVGKLYS